ncbi:hypothetical protein ColTof3_14842 [Colletotrichum tofieldiae]|nr:hypothetical protein ColTof3_14842 [Colletotrichum tofieldiae]
MIGNSIRSSTREERGPSDVSGLLERLLSANLQTRMATHANANPFICKLDDPLNGLGAAS